MFYGQNVLLKIDKIFRDTLDSIIKAEMCFECSDASGKCKMDVNRLVHYSLISPCFVVSQKLVKMKGDQKFSVNV